MDIPEPVFTLGPSEPKPEPPDVLIGCIKVDIYSQSSGVTGNVNEDVIRVNTPSKQGIIGTVTDSQILRLEGSKGTELPRQTDCQIFICEVCEEEFNEELFLLNHKLVNHWIPIEMSLTHLPGHRTDHTKIRADHTKKPKQKELKENPKVMNQQHSALPKNPTKKPRQKTAHLIRTKTQVKADVKLKTGSQDFAKISETPLEQTPKQGKKKSCKEQIPEKKDCVLCPQCGKTFAKRGGLTKHLKRHSNERPFICDVCNKSFMLQEYLKSHQRQHTGETPFTCGECGRGFARRDSLRYHCLTHSKTKQFRCDACPKTYHRNVDLQNHIRRHNGTYFRKHRCSTERSYMCHVCGKVYAHADELKDHTITHRPTGELPFQCDACGKSYSRRSLLTDHFTNIHMKRTIPCPTCNKKFPTVVKMNRHCRMSHDAEKSFKCEECTMAFISQKRLDRHMYTHTGNGPHMCEHCGRRFSTGSNCRAHQKICY